MFTASVNSVEGFFVKQTNKTVLRSYLLHYLHCKLVVIGGNVRGGVDGSKLVLSRCNFVVFRFCKNTELPQLLVKFSHKGCYSRLYNTEIVVVHFLTLRCFCSEKRSAAEKQILAFFKHLFINEEILLLGSYRSTNTFNLRIAEQTENSERLFVECLH